jgi:AcrR family transcriptional regulator
MREWVPVPGTAKARLVEAAIHHFETAGYEAASVTDLAAKADVTTGSLYHHFTSKLGLYLLIREEMERRVVDRMTGAIATAGAMATADGGGGGDGGLAADDGRGAAAGGRGGAAASGRGRAATGSSVAAAGDGGRVVVRAALLVAFDAAVHFGVWRSRFRRRGRILSRPSCGRWCPSAAARRA